jgi:phosphatidylinositol 3-kinase
MVHKSGALFHIDFGYMFGRDPKPIKQEMVINREMVLGFGGRESSGFHKYRTYCWKAFQILRKNYYLILNMLILMTDAKIPDLSVLQDSKKVMMFMRSRFKIQLNDADAEVWLYENLNKNANAFGPVFMEYLHRKFSISE